MPPNMVDTAAEEKAWKKAKARAAKEGHAEDWPYVVAIFQAMTGKKGTAKGAVGITTINDLRRKQGLPPIDGKEMAAKFAQLDPSTGMGDAPTWTTAAWHGGPLGPIVDVLRKATVADEPDYTRDGDSNPFVVVGGLKIHVEKFPGESRGRGYIQNATYGEVIGVDGADGEAFDVVVGQHRNAPIAYVIDQLDANGALDEHKAMVGWLTPEDAARAYAGQWGRPKMGGMTAIPVADLARCLLNHPQVSAVPFADYLDECGYTPVRVWVSFTGPGPIASPDTVAANGGMALGAPGR